MQWDKTKNAGFSTAPRSRLYLPVDHSPTRPSVRTQLEDHGSLLHFVRALIALRTAVPALQAKGGVVPVFARKGRCPFVYLRTREKKRILVAVNPSRTVAQARLSLKGAPSGELLLGRGCALTARGGRVSVRMRGFSFGIWDLSQA
jgi:maltose alpha-D-glucosyltransferase/alpha-amylase